MKISILKDLKIPTVLGLGIIIIGIIIGVFLVLQGKTFITHAYPDLTPKNITISNISDNSATISWETDGATVGFVTYGQESSEENPVLDERDGIPPNGKPNPHTTHYVIIKKLMPKTEYKFKVVSGSSTKSQAKTFTTSNPQAATSKQPVIGTVLDNDTPLEEGIAYLKIDSATIQSALIKTKGGFLIPLNNILSTGSNEPMALTDETIAKIEVVSTKGTAGISFKISQSQHLPVLKLGDNLDLTENQDVPQPILNLSGITNFDLNGDGETNAADNAIVLNNFGKNPKDKTADLNNDSVVDEKDLELISKHINQ